MNRDVLCFGRHPGTRVMAFGTGMLRTGKTTTEGKGTGSSSRARVSTARAAPLASGRP